MINTVYDLEKTWRGFNVEQLVTMERNVATSVSWESLFAILIYYIRSICASKRVEYRGQVRGALL